VSGVLVSKEKNLLLGVFLAIFPLFIDAVLGYRRPAACNNELGCYLLLSTMIGTVLMVYSMLPNMEINEK
jgi:hypothetical protein